MRQINGYLFPEGLYFHTDHTWVREEPDGSLTIGMTDFYVQNAGDTTYIDLPEEDDEIVQGETAGKIQSSKWVGKLVSPVSGTVRLINEDLEDDFMLINRDPYGAGWIMTIDPSDWDDEQHRLMSDESALNRFVEDEVRKLEADDGS
ncbi:glycine cleavage system protein H [bacterium]|nr:glycine cleavage system protein H [candidate division CSSED10-310 bacterium]